MLFCVNNKEIKGLPLPERLLRLSVQNDGKVVLNLPPLFCCPISKE